jgi:hypothetical protein
VPKLLKINKLHSPLLWKLGVLIFCITGLILWALRSRTQDNIFTLFLLFLNWFGVLLLLEYVYNRQTHCSIIFPHTRSTKLRLVLILVVAYTLSLGVDIFGFYLVRLWYFPKFDMDILTYFVIGPVLYIQYGVILFLIYEIIKNALHWKNKSGKFNKRDQTIYKLLVYSQLSLGVVLLVISVIYLYILFKQAQFSTLNWINQSGNIEISWWLPFAAAFGAYAIFDYLSFIFGKSTLLKDIYTRRLQPLAVIVLAALGGIIFTELLNVPLQIWTFSNWPLGHLRLLNIPLLAWLSWPVQFIALLTMLRLALKEKDIDIW